MPVSTSSDHPAQRSSPLRGAFLTFCAGLVLAVTASAARAPTNAPAVRLPTEPQPALALEVELAATPAIYVVIDVAAQRLDVRARGMILDRIPLDGIALVRDEPLLRAGAQPLELTLPALWRITNRSGVASREVITPRSLEAYPEDGEVPDRPAAKRVAAKPPATYYLEVEGGWSVSFDRALPGTTFWKRFGTAVRTGAERLFGLEPSSRPTLALAIGAADAERLHHLLRRETLILVLAPEPQS